MSLNIKEGDFISLTNLKNAIKSMELIHQDPNYPVRFVAKTLAIRELMIAQLKEIEEHNQKQLTKLARKEVKNIREKHFKF